MRSHVSRLLLVGSLALGFPVTSFAFHSGGVGECEGCHTMHNSKVNAPMSTVLPQFEAGPYLLQGSDASSTCLHCHAAADAAPYEHHILTYPVPGAGQPPVELTPGGDFAWLKKSYTWQPEVGAPVQSSPGDRHGHNVVAVDYGFTADATITASPGGQPQYPAANLSCISCHDPHGRYRRAAAGTIVTSGLPTIDSGSYADSPNPTAWGGVGVYRLLGGIGYQPKSLVGAYAFQYQAPAAVAPRAYNRSEATTQTRVAYGRSMSLWCANCHTLMHSGLASTYGAYVHPADQTLGPYVPANYNSYVYTGRMNGTVATSYLSLVPFQTDNTTNYTTLKGLARSDNTNLTGPTSTDRVMCLTCHRAHASAWDSTSRWSHGNEFLTVGDAAGVPSYPDPVLNPAQAQGRSQAEYRASMYDRPPAKFAPYQRSLCNKCHAQD